MKSTREWVAATVLMMGAATVGAQDGSAIRLAFNIPAQPLDAALTDFAQATGLQLLVLSEIAHERSAPVVSGSLTPERALQELLEGSGLSYQFVNGRTVAISSTEGFVGTILPVGVLSESRAVDDSNFRVAQATSPTVASSANGESTVITEPRGAPEVLVRGSRVLNMDIKRTEDDAQPYVVFDRKAIEKSGASTIEDFLRTRMTASSPGPQAAQSSDGDNQSAFNLRGLGTEQTLVLVDGHRIAPRNGGGGVAQPDLNGIPLAAIERIEVLPATASGIYGGGATGGAINVVLRRDYTGLETKLTYENSFDGGGINRRADVSVGFNLEGGRTNILFAGSYSDASEVFNRDRDFLTRARQRILQNNPATFSGSSVPPLGATTNIATPRRLDTATLAATGKVVFLPGPNLVLDDGTPLGTSITHVPLGYAGPSSDGGAALLANAGSYNLNPADTVQFVGGKNASLLNGPTIRSFTATVRREFNEQLQMFLDLSTSRNEGVFTSNRVSGTFTLPANSPANPFRQQIVVTTPAFGTDTVSETKAEDDRAVAGLIFRLSDSWLAEADYTWSRNRYSSTSSGGRTLSTAATAAIRNGTLDVFRDTNDFGVDFSSYLSAADIVPDTGVVLKDLATRISGSLPIELPGGNPTLLVALERREENLDDYVLLSPTGDSNAYSRSQDVDSAFAEARLPIFSELNRLPGFYAAALELKVRWDHYDVTGANQGVTIEGIQTADAPETVRNKFSSTDPTVGFTFKPVADLMFRASYGTGFMPPAMSLLVPFPSLEINGGGFGLTDPLRGNEPLGDIISLGGGRPDLRPEQSESRSAGFVVTPRIIPELRVSWDWTQIKKRDNVSIFGLSQDTINLEALVPGLIIRDQPSTPGEAGPIVAIDSRAMNSARQNIEAMDVAAGYRLQTQSLGSFSLELAATRNIHSSTQVSAGSQWIENVALSGALKWRANTLLSWDYRQWSVAWHTHFYDSYFVQLSHEPLADQGSSTIPSQTYHDVFLTYRSGRSAPWKALSDTEVQLGVKNVFNKEPPFVALAPYYSTLADPRLASYYLSVRKGF